MEAQENLFSQKREIKNKIFILKENNQDYEWYPTTDVMIEVVKSRCGDIESILDIGAGDGRVLKKFDCKKYAIEKSEIHIENMPGEIAIVGTDFMAQTLLDKRVEVIFCNPPYSEFEDWTVKIIKEAYAHKIFLVIPERWSESKLIKAVIKQRDLTHKIIWTGDFLNADRKARAKVNIVEFTIHKIGWGEREFVDPFELWFNEYFKGFDKVIDQSDDEDYNPGDNKRIKYELLEGQNLIDCLCNLYNNELKKLLDNYKTLSKLDGTLLKEIGIKKNEIKGAMKQKISGLKNKYWQELFDNLEKITSRLTKESRQNIVDLMNSSCNVDFSYDNAFAVVIWVIKNANKYLDSQLVDMFKKLSEPAHIKAYKSNLRTWEKERWRFHNRENFSHYQLDYRIVSVNYRAIVEDGSYHRYDSTNRLYNDAHDFLNDIFTIANNLGFTNICNSKHRQWESNSQETFYFCSGSRKELVSVRAFKNGNIHLKFNMDFIKALNIEASRLLGWIKSPREASDEMNIDINFVKSRYGSNLLFDIAYNQKLLMAS